MNSVHAVVYLLGSLFLASTLGLAAIPLLKRFELPRLTKFLIGAASLPYILGIYMLLITVIPFRMHNIVYVIIPYIICSVFLILYFRRNGTDLKLEGKISELTIVGLCSALISGPASSYISGWGGFTITLLISTGTLTGILFLANSYVLCRKATRLSGKRIALDCGFLVLFLITCRLTYASASYSSMIIRSAAIFIASVVFGIIYIKTSENDKQRDTARFLTLFQLINSGIMINTLENNAMNNSYVMLATLGVIGLAAVVFFVVSYGSKPFTKMFADSEYLITCIASIVLFVIIKYIMGRSIGTVIGSDAIQYLSEAYDYTIGLKFGTMNDFHGDAAGTLLSNIHSPVWPAYLSNGLLYADKVGYPHDLGARMAFGLTYIYMLCIIFALGYTFRGKFSGLITSCILFANENISALVISMTREGFRLIPLIAFAILLIGLPRKIRPLDAVILMMSTAFIMVGHPINAITAIAVGFVFTIWYFIAKRGTVGNLILSYIPCGIGAALGSYQIFQAYLETGSMTGGLIDFEDVFEGTTYYDTYVTNFANSLGHNMNYWDKILGIITKDNGIIFIPALIITIIMFIMLLKKKQAGSATFFIIMIALAQFLMLTEIFQWSGRSYVEWCYRNFRYTVQMYIFYALLISIFIKDVVFALKVNWKKITSSLIVIVYLAIPLGIEYLYIIDHDINEKCLFYYDDIREFTDRNEPGKILLDNYNMNYYLNNRGICFWTKPVDALRHADTDDEFYEEAKKLGISAILITDANREIYWDNTEIDSFITSQYIKGQIHINSESANSYTIYMLK